MSTATKFEFVGYDYERGETDIGFHYRTHFSDVEPIDFTEVVSFSEDWDATLPDTFLDTVLDDLHLVLGISYYKLFCPAEFIGQPPLTTERAAFWNTLYQKGLGEFLYRNELSPSTVATFSDTTNVVAPPPSYFGGVERLLVGIGGGKDSIVSLELLHEYERLGFVVETGKTNEIAGEVANRAGVPMVTVRRTLDPKMLAGVPGSYSGHVPISAVYAFLGVVQAAASGASAFVVSNEYSSNFGNLAHEGNEVNHQWSKSQEFETLFQTYLRDYLTPDIQYFSLLRPLYEIRIVELFAQLGRRYFDVFSSCNKNFTQVNEHDGHWCNQCAKCAFNHLLLAAWLQPEEVRAIFGADLLDQPELVPLYQDILGYGEAKPFDCVGTFAEARLALVKAAAHRVKPPVVIREFLERATQDVDESVLQTAAATTVPSRFRLLGMRSVLLLGYGREGMVTEQFLQKFYPHLEIAIADQTDGDDYLTKQHTADIVIKTPGIPQRLVTAHQVSATQLFFAHVQREQIIGITGSKGKSTTATVLHNVLKTADEPVELVGNIGVPLLEPLVAERHTPDTLYVCELSSYQTETLDVSPHTVILTSLFPDHLDHHGSLAAYHQAKRQLMAHQRPNDYLVFPTAYTDFVEWAAASPATVLSPVALSYTNEHLPGAHMQENVALAYAVSQIYGASEADARAVVEAFAGLPHRLELVGEKNGVRFYNDSISTTPESAIAALHALPGVETIMLGGLDRGYDFTQLEKALTECAVQNVVFFPDSGEQMLTDETKFNVLHTADMDAAVAFAAEHTTAGAACVLSPAAPSYNAYTNFEERGEAFKQAVAQLR